MLALAPDLLNVDRLEGRSQVATRRVVIHLEVDAAMNRAKEPVFVLGCSRLGSTMTPMDKQQSLAFIRKAYSLGVRHFDTASIYGQGDSERLLGEALQSRGDVFIATKAGQRLTPLQQVMRPLKPLVRRLIRRRVTPADGVPLVAPTSQSATLGVIAAQRARGVDYCFDTAFLLASLQHSLRRLRAEKVELFYLHSPTRQALAEPGLWQALETARSVGYFRQLGVSCDDLDAAEAALDCAAVDVLQFEPDSSVRSAAVLQRAATRQVRVYARLGASRTGGVQEALHGLVAAPAVNAVLMGTTRLDHLVENLQAFQAVAKQKDAPP